MRPRHFVSRDGAELFGWEVGDGPTLVLLHAGGERANVWVSVAETLSSQYCQRCIAIDQRGHGASGGAAERLSDFGDDVREILRSVGEPCVVVGASLGGFAAIDALRFPDVTALTAGIVLVDVVPDPDSVRVRRFLTSIDMHLTHHVLIDDILDAGPRLRQQLADSEVPVHLVRATGSSISPDEIERLGRSAVELAVTSVDTGHLVAREAPDVLAAIVGPLADTWLERTSA